MSYSKEELIAKAIAPAPWYWESFPSIIGEMGNKYTWRFHNSNCGKLGFTYLCQDKQDSVCKMVLNTYTRVFSVPPYYLGVWYKKDGMYIIDVFNPEELQDFNIGEVTEESLFSKKNYFTQGQPIETTSFQRITEGPQSIKYSSLLEGIDEILIVDSFFSIDKQDNSEEAIYAIFELHPKDDSLRVIPQSWFNSEDFDIGYEWITRVIRVPGTDRIIGDGIRIGAFELTENGQKFNIWLKR
jgi:hypothetical protein